MMLTIGATLGIAPVAARADESIGGSVLPFGGAPALGSLAGEQLAGPVVGMAATPDGRGYWLVASDGGVFTFGDPRLSMHTLN